MGTRLVISGAISVGTLTALAVYVARIYGPLTSLTNAQVEVMTALVSFERVFEVLDAPLPIEDAPDATALVDAKGRIEFDDVWFRYPSAASVSIASLEADTTSPLEHRGVGHHPARRLLRGRAGPDGRPGRARPAPGRRRSRIWSPASTT